jgi:anti-sigma B factor antagonist
MSGDSRNASNQETVILVAGELDFHSAPELRQAILTALNEGASRLVLDLGEMEFIDSSGLSVIIAAFKRCRERGGELILRSVTERTRRVLEVSGLNKVFSIE